MVKENIEKLAEIEDFVYGDLDKLISNPNDLFDKLPPISDTLEGTRERNKKLSELQEKFMLESFYPLKEKAKQYIITP